MSETVLTASRARVAAYHIPELILGSMFPLLYVWAIKPADHIPNWANAFFALAALFGLAIAFRASFRILRVWRAIGEWSVHISDARLLWVTGVRDKGYPLEISLSDIAQCVVLETLSIDSEKARETVITHEIHHKNGTVTKIDQTFAGVNPDAVFCELKQRGIPFRLFQLDKTTDLENKDRQLVQDY